MRHIALAVVFLGFVFSTMSFADRGFVPRPNQITPTDHGFFGPEGDPTASFDVTGLEFIDLEGDPDNTILMLDIGTPLGMAGMDVEVNGIGWDFTLSTVGASWASEATIGFDWDSDWVNDVYLNASITDGPVTMEALTSGGPVNLSTFSIPNGIVPGGILRIELFDTFEDFPNSADAFINSGTLTIQAEPGSTVSGDFNGDGNYDCLDIDALVMEIFGGANNPAFDLTNDGSVNIDDRDAWLSEAGAVNLPSGNPYFTADFNLNGAVDGDDFLIWNMNKFQNVNEFCRGDANADGLVDGLDFLEWNLHKFQSADALQQVPEPCSMILGCLSALFGLMIRRQANFDTSPKRSGLLV